MRYVIRSLGRATAVLALGLAASASALAGGPPWISVEAPVDPLNRSAQGAAMLVRVYSCGQPTDSPVDATAEGIVNGERRSVPIKLRPTGELGVYAVDQQWPAEGTWALALTLPKLAPTTTLVQLGSNGGVETDSYYKQPSKSVRLASVRVFGRRLSATEIDTALRATPSGVAALPASSETSSAWFAAMLGAPVLVGLVAAGRRRRARS